MKFWIALLIITFLFAPKAFASDGPDASATGDEQVTGEPVQQADEREMIIALLSHHHELPDRRMFERASDDARTIVFDIARDEEAFLFHRQRAFRALTYWADDEIYDYLVGLLHDDDTEDGLRHHLLPTIVNGFGADALEDIRPYLFDADDPQIRISAAGAIATLDDERALRMLTEALEVEQNPVVERRLEQYATQKLD